MSESELRALVREVLIEAIQAKRLATAPTLPPIEPVRIADDDDLSAFVKRLVAMLDDPRAAAAIRAGNNPFRLAGPARAPIAPSAADAISDTALVVLSGAVTEQRIAALTPGSKLRLAPDAVLTPLARDRARAMRIVIERKR